MVDTHSIYPYAVDPDRHPLAWVFFNVAGTAKFDLDTADTLAKHVFGDLACGGPGTAGEPQIIYDALGSSGGPWELGAWIKADEPRRKVRTTAPDKDVTAMTEEERAELRAALEAAEDAARAGAINSDETTPPPNMPDSDVSDEREGD